MERKERLVVVDASIVVKWFVEEDYSRESRLLRDSYVNGLVDITAPSILPYKVLNTLKYSGAFGEDAGKSLDSGNCVELQVQTTCTHEDISYIDKESTERSVKQMANLL